MKKKVSKEKWFIGWQWFIIVCVFIGITLFLASRSFGDTYETYFRYSDTTADSVTWNVFTEGDTLVTGTASKWKGQNSGLWIDTITIGSQSGLWVDFQIWTGTDYDPSGYYLNQRSNMIAIAGDSIAAQDIDARIDTLVDTGIAIYAEIANIDAWNPITDNDSLIVDMGSLSERPVIGDTIGRNASIFNVSSDSVIVDVSSAITTDGLVSKIEDSVHALTADYKATGFSTHNAADVWTATDGDSVLNAIEDVNKGNFKADVSLLALQTEVENIDGWNPITDNDSLVVDISSLALVLANQSTIDSVWDTLIVFQDTTEAALSDASMDSKIWTAASRQLTALGFDLDSTDFDSATFPWWLFTTEYFDSTQGAASLTAMDVWNVAFGAGFDAGSMGDSLNNVTYVQGSASGLDSAIVSRVVGRKVWGIATGSGNDSTALSDRKAHVESMKAAVVTASVIAASAITVSEAPNLDAAITSRSNHSAADVWTSGTRNLTDTANLTGLTIDIPAGGITVAEFGIGAIDSTVIAADAIGASELASTAAAEIEDSVHVLAVDYKADVSGVSTFDASSDSVIVDVSSAITTDGLVSKIEDTVHALTADYKSDVSALALQTEVANMDGWNPASDSVLTKTPSAYQAIATVPSDTNIQGETTAIMPQYWTAEDSAGYQGSAAGMDTIDIADAVWNRLASEHTVGGSFGAHLDDTVSNIDVSPDSGSRILTLYFEDTANSSMVPYLKHTLQSSDGAVNYSFKYTGSGGTKTWSLDDGTYLVTTSGYSFIQEIIPDTTVVSGNTTDTLSLYAFDPGGPAGAGAAAKCRVWSRVYNKDGVTGREGVRVTVTMPNVVRYGNVPIYHFAEITSTDSTGYWYFDLVRSDSLTPSAKAVYQFIANDTLEIPDIFNVRSKVPDTASWQLQYWR